MDLNFIYYMVAATLLPFILGALWYSAIFGKKWSAIHGFDQLSLEEQKKLSDSMTPYYGLQLLLSIALAFGYGWLWKNTGADKAMLTSVLLFCFVAPTISEGIIWAGSAQKHWFNQHSIMIGNKVIYFILMYVCAMYFLK
ncbi:MAG: DUF1761 domain-containing protein [Patescibacteria group bacterium]